MRNILAFLADIFAAINAWLVGLLEGLGASRVVIDGVMAAIGSVLIIVFLLTLALFIIWVERKVVGRIQDRIGPNRVGPWGIFQNVADVLKLLTKEIIIPDGADLVPYMLAPIVAVASVFLIWAVLPFTSSGIGSDVGIGALYIVAVGSLGVMAVLLAGWSSNNKYALLGAFRAVAMLVSYEVPMILMLLVPVMLTGSLRVNAIVESQRVWYVFAMPLAAIIFYIANVAEVGRSPFDLLEAESEIVAGFHIEYSGMAFAMFYLAEFLHAFTISAMSATLFLGGWRGPFVDQVPTLGVVYFAIKTFAVYFFNVWTRGTLPRMRIDHTMSFCWKFLVPVALVLLVLAALVDKIGQLIIPGYLVTDTAVAMLPRTGLLLVVNLVVGAFALGWIAWQGRRERVRREAALRRATAIEPGAAQQAR
jgi:NADH-quinone oxidoreductase subunit H